MSDDIQGSEDPLIKEVLEEIAAEENGNKATPAETPAEPIEPVKTEEIKTEEAVEDKTDDTEPPAKPNREVKYVPVGKHNEERHKRQEAEKLAADREIRIKELEAQFNNSKPSEDNKDDIAEAAKLLAERNGMDADLTTDFVKSIVDIAAKRNVLPDEIKQKLDNFEQMTERARLAENETNQEKGFEKEFAAIVTEFPHLADQKDALKQIVFSEDNINTPLRPLALEYMHDNPSPQDGKKSAETPTQGGSRTEAVDFSSMTEEQFAGLSEEQMVLYDQWSAKNGKSR